MQLRRILTLILLMLAGSVQAQSRGDDAIVAMQQAYRQGDRARLAQLLPQVIGHVLEPWGAYWELKNRLETASAQEIQDFFARYAGTYQEDRLRNDWLLLLGQRRDWATFAAEYPKYRMKDDREVRCYALVATELKGDTPPSAAIAEEVRRLWLSQRDADDGCRIAAGLLIAQREGPGRLTAQDAWRKARLALEFNRTRAAAGAVELVAPDALPQLNDLIASPARYLTSRVVVASKRRKEMIVLALIKLAGGDRDNASRLLENKWGPQLAPEERNWVWGVIAKQAAQRLGSASTDALALYEKVSRAADLSDDMLAWKARAALRAPRGPQWPVVLQAINAMSEQTRSDTAWTYWKARALLAARGETRHAEGAELLQSIASVRGFYEQLALEELGQKVTVPPRAEPPTPQEKEAVRL